jgi:lipid-binding SYLF domain-containing protein
MKLLATSICLTLLLSLSGCAITGNKTVEQKRQAVQAMKDEVLTDLYQRKPDVRNQIANAAGYGVFSNANVKVILVSAGGGYGVVKNNNTGRQTYMNMGEFGVGLGLGAKDVRFVFVFHTQEALNRFIDYGWSFGIQGDAAAKAADKGGAIGGEVAADNVTVYQITENGLALQATVKGTKFWINETLN